MLPRLAATETYDYALSFYDTSVPADQNCRDGVLKRRNRWSECAITRRFRAPVPKSLLVVSSSVTSCTRGPVDDNAGPYVKSSSRVIDTLQDNANANTCLPRALRVFRRWLSRTLLSVRARTYAVSLHHCFVSRLRLLTTTIGRFL